MLKSVFWVQVGTVKKIAPVVLAGCLGLSPSVRAAGQSTITVTQGANGTITPGGTVTVTNGSSPTFTISPDSGYTITDVVVDGSNVGVSSPWTDLGVIDNNTRIRSFSYLGNGIVLASGETIAPNSSLHRSTDYGQTWTHLGPQAGGVIILNLAYAGDGIVLASCSNGVILRSTDYGESWVNLGSHFGQQNIYAIEYVGNGLLFAGTYPDGLLLRSTDYGASWTNMGRLGNETNIITIESFDNGILVAGGGTDGNIWRSTNNGATWTNLGNQAGEKDIDYIVHMGNGIAIASAYPNGKLLRSTDFGLTWTDLGIFDGEIMNNVAHMGNGIGVVGGGSTGHMWRTADYGATWMDLGQQGGEQWIESVYLENGIFLAGTGPLIIGATGPHGKILRSTASGLGTSTTYTFQNVQASHAITAYYSPVPVLAINSFIANPTSVAAGESATLNWDVTNATSVSISPLPAGCTPLPPAGSCSVSPASTTTYTLTASDDGVNLTATATVQVVGAPVMSIVTATVSGLTVTITWTTDQRTTEQIFYGTSQSLGSASPVGADLQTTHKMTFYNLPRKTTFYYQAYSANAAGQVSSAIKSFVTSARANAPGPPIITAGR